MINLKAYNARTYFSGPERELKRMFRCLRVKDKNAYWKAKAIIRRMTFLHALPEDKRSEKIEKIKRESLWIKFYDRRTDSFASGLLSRVRSFLKRRGRAYSVRDRRTKHRTTGGAFRKIDFSDKIEVRAEQIEAIKKALDAGRGILHCATNFGKTEVACAIVLEFLKQTKKIPNVLFLIHRAGLVLQTMERFQKHLADTIPIAMIGAGQKKIPSRSGVLVATTQTASILLKASAFASFLKKCDIVFVDEFHINRAWQATRILNRCEAPMRFGLSGTIDKKSKVKLMHYTGMTGPIIAEVRNEELVRLGRSAKPIIRFLEVPSQKIKGKFAESYRAGVVNNEVRNALVLREVIRYVEQDYKTLVTVGRISHGRILLRMLEKHMDIPCEFIYGGTPLSIRKKVIRRFENGKVPILIASPIFDVGMDVPAIEAWVNAAGGKGWELVLQRLGRVLRRKEGENRVYISDFVDVHNKYLMRHSMARMQYYMDEKIAEITLAGG